MADALRVKNPPRLNEITKAIKETNGLVVTVNDDEIAAALRVSFKMGFFIEPSSATAIAALRKLIDENFVKKDEKTVIPLTGSGFKAINKLLLQGLK